MEKTTLEIILISAGAIATSIITIITLLKLIKKWFNKKINNLRCWLDEPSKTRYEYVTKSLSDLQVQFTDFDFKYCKREILKYLEEKKSGFCHSDAQEQDLFDMYTHYTQNLHKNGYVAREWNDVNCKGGIMTNKYYEEGGVDNE